MENKYHFEDESNIPLSLEQLEILEHVSTGKHIFISGPAGVGKSFLLKKIKQRFPHMPITGSTGKAAFNVDGITIHSWAGLGIMKDSPKKIAENIRKNNSRAKKNITQTSILAVDEISMLSAKALDCIDQVFQIIRNDQRPFGGIQMVLFGDWLQMPPVSKDNSEKFAFEANVWKYIETCILKKIFRQKDPEFAKVLNHIRLGKQNELITKLFEERSITDPEEETHPAVIVHTHNHLVDKINKEKLEKLDEELVEFKAEDIGSDPIKATIEKHCPSATTLQLKKGARVMLLVNLEQKKGLINGSTGFVVGFTSSNPKLPIIHFDNNITKIIEKNVWKMEDGNKLLGSRTQLPIRLAWAVTSHKIQGLTLEKAKVFLENLWEDGQAYVALSRVKTKQGLFIANGTPSCIRANPKAIKFYEIEEQKRWVKKLIEKGDKEAIKILEELENSLKPKPNVEKPSNTLTQPNLDYGWDPK